MRQEIMSMDQIKQLRSEFKKQGRLNSDNTISLYHVLPSDYVSSVLEKGLSPAFHPAPGQSWVAAHSKYATYFHADKLAAIENVKQGDGYLSLIEAKIPVTPKSMIRVLPDEDVDTNVKKGLRALKETSSIAYIGGVPARSLKLLMQ
jgi:hypothetical protein